MNKTIKYLLLLLFIGLVWGQESYFYIPKIDLFGSEISTWHVMGWMNIFLGKTVILFYGYKKGWNFSEWATIILFATTGAAIASFLLPTIVGTLIGFLSCLYLGKRLVGFHHDIGIVISLFIAIAFAIGRIGCLLNGCCFGSITTLPWGIDYPIGTPAHWLHLFTDLIPNTHLNSLSVHPIQLYESIFHIISAILIMVSRKRFKKNNAILLFYFSSYLIFRFFIEFIRDMNNVWWSALSLGPLSLFQWFLFFIALSLIIYGVILEKKYKPIFTKVQLGYSVENNFLLILCCLITILIFKNQIQTIHLVQLAIMLPLSACLYLIELKKRHAFFYPIPRYVTASMFALLFSTPIISQIESRLDDNQSIKTNQTEYSKRWVYTINENNNTLLRIGNKGMSFEEFNRRKKLANLFPNQASDSIKNIYNKIKNDNKSGMQYFGSIGGGFQSFEISGCSGTTKYTIMGIGGTLGKEKKEAKPKSDIYSGYRSNLYLSNILANSDSYFNPRFSLHSYKNIDLKFIGFGLGLSGVLARDLGIFSDWMDDISKDTGLARMLFIYPNAHIRLGPKGFNLQAGISDRYHNIYNPMVAHLSLGFKNNLRIGVTNQSPDFPIMTAGFFVSSNNIYFMLGPSGISYGSKFSF